MEQFTPRVKEGCATAKENLILLLWPKNRVIVKLRENMTAPDVVLTAFNDKLALKVFAVVSTVTVPETVI